MGYGLQPAEIQLVVQKGHLNGPLVTLDQLDTPVQTAAFLGIVRGGRRQLADSGTTQSRTFDSMVVDQRSRDRSGAAFGQTHVVLVAAR